MYFKMYSFIYITDKYLRVIIFRYLHVSTLHFKPPTNTTTLKIVNLCKGFIK